MWPDRVLNPGPLTYVSGALLTVLHGLAIQVVKNLNKYVYTKHATVLPT